MFKLGKGKTPVRRQFSIAASTSGVHIRSGLSGVVDLSSGMVMSLYGQRILCLVQLRLFHRVSGYPISRILLRYAPLREVLITSNVASFARIQESASSF